MDQGVGTFGETPKNILKTRVQDSFYIELALVIALDDFQGYHIAGS